MDFLKDEELHGYLVFILFKLKKKKFFPLKRPQNNLVKRNIEENSSVRTLH